MRKSEEIQKELDDIMRETGIFKKADERYAAKLIERIVWGILSLFGVAIVAAIIHKIGL